VERDAVLRGLAENPTVPVDVLVRLLAGDSLPPVAMGLRARADLPPELQAHMEAHPYFLVRAVLSGHRRVDPAIRDRLLDDPHWRVRTWGFDKPDEPPVPEGTLMRLMTNLYDVPANAPYTRGDLFEELFFQDWSRAEVAARHPDPRLRRYAIPSVTRDTLAFLLDDPDPTVAAEAADALAERERLMQPADLPEHHCHAFWWVLHRPLSRALAEQVVASGDVEAVRTIATNDTLPSDLVDALSHNPDCEARTRIAARPDLTGEQVQRLATDPDPAVRAVVATRAGLTAGQIERLAADPDETVRTAVATHAYVSEKDRQILDGHEELNPGDVRRWARSDNPRLRRRAAQRPDLPGDLVTVLAADSDQRVRAELAQHHPDAPADLLLSCYLADGQSRPRLLSRPQFPSADLARFAHDADPEIRALAARDPEADPALIAHLVTDPAECVRRRMARCPRLPADRMIALLNDPELARDAAANPALPWVTVVERLTAVT
jgi:hypothetical protein